MRKSNSEFKTAFVSEAGGELANNDYFAYVELDDYACYVLASGITDFRATEAARLAVEHLLLTFEEHPGMSKGLLTRYMEETNGRLLAAANTQERMKASVVAIVTDYEKFRYVSAGNVRMRMYRQGRFVMSSSDMSLARDLIERRESDTVLDRHEERHNLYAYLGKQGGCRPFVSPKYPCMDGDILALYTGGFWEHVDSQEIDEIFHEASNDPRESLDTLEELLLSRQPKDLKSYTVAAIFVNKSYRDPERERKRARNIKIAIIVMIVLLLVGLIGFFLYHRHQNKVEQLMQAEEETIEFMKADNYVRAEESCKSALDQAKDLGRHEDETRMRGYLLVIDGINAGDEAFKAKDYTGAFNTYMTAENNSRELADRMGMSYLEKRIAQTEDFLYVSDFLALGNKAMDSGDLDKAELVYYKARDKAAAIHDEDGRKAAVDALESLYDKKAKEKDEVEKKIKQSNEAAVADAMKKGDELMAKGDIEGAEKAYLEARAIANSGGDKESRADAMKSLEQVHQAKAEKAVEEMKAVDDKNRQYAIATDAASKGDNSYTAGDYISAQIYYQSAMDKFQALGETAMAEQMKTKLDNAVQKQGVSMQAQKNAQEAEEKAKALYAGKDYAGAKQSALTAKQLYAGMGNQGKVDEMNLLIGQIDMDAVIDKSLQ